MKKRKIYYKIGDCKEREISEDEFYHLSNIVALEKQIFRLTN